MAIDLDTLRVTVAHAVRSRRGEMRLSQDDLAAMTTVGRPAIANIENARQLPSLLLWAQLCAVLRLDPGLVLLAAGCAECLDRPPPGYACLACGTSTERMAP